MPKRKKIWTEQTVKLAVSAVLDKKKSYGKHQDTTISAIPCSGTGFLKQKDN